MDEPLRPLHISYMRKNGQSKKIENVSCPVKRQTQEITIGDMGCGKSVTMSFLVDELGRRNKYQLPQPKIC